MRKYRAIAVTATIAGMLLTPVPAYADPPADPSALVTEYFVASDLAWYGTNGPAAGSSRLRNGTVSPAARRFSDAIAAIARDARRETGLQANGVSTLVDNLETSAAVDRHVYSSHVATRLDWNVGELGYSVLADDYVVTVERSGSSWTVSAVDMVAPPRDDAEPVPDPEDPPSVPCKPGEVCEPENISLTAGRAAAARQRAARGGDTPDPSGWTPGNGVTDLHFDHLAAAAYAIRWSGNDGGKDRYNPSYKRLDNNCTNFVSQAMRAGHWPVKDGWDPDDKDNWSPDLNGPYGPSKTWSRAHYLMDFATKRTDRGSIREIAPAAEAIQIWNMGIGDLMFIDWESDQGFDHVVIVVDYYRDPGSDFFEPAVSQNSPHRQNVPLYIYIKRAALQNQHMTFATMQTNHYFTT